MKTKKSTLNKFSSNQGGENVLFQQNTLNLGGNIEN